VLKPLFFKTPAELRRWFAANHATATELLLGIYKKSSGKPSVTYFEALDEALCVGWIDGVRRSLDAERFVQRFTPRRPKSYWSLVNINKARALIAAGRMKAAGRRAFAKRDEAAARKYSFEQKQVALPAALERHFRQNTAAWAFFQAQPPGYRRLATWFILSARRDETRLKRLDRLIDLCARGRRLEPMAPASSSK
jgi:uncharacterized protein YdeI (YjbR/CyaY-like superfamily)